MARAWNSAFDQEIKLALEGMVDGKLKREFEHVWFAEMKGDIHFPGLKKAASWEYQEQWEVRVDKSELIPASGQVRVRMVCQGGDSFMDLGEPQYIFTVKVKGADGGQYEAEQEISADIFKTFKWLAGRGMEKDRYYFPSEGKMFELDMYLLPGLAQGRLKGMKNRGRDYNPWGKIDFEYDDPNAPIPAIPFEADCVQIIDGGSPHRKVAKTAEQNKILDRLFKEVFNSRNPLLPSK